MKPHQNPSIVTRIQDLNDHRRAVFQLARDRVITVRTGLNLMKDIADRKAALLSNKE